MRMDLDNSKPLSKKAGAMEEFKKSNAFLMNSSTVNFKPNISASPPGSPDLHRLLHADESRSVNSKDSASSPLHLSRLKRVTHGENLGLELNAAAASANTVSCRPSTPAGIPRIAQDTLLVQQLKAGLLPENLLKTSPHMQYMTSIDLSHYSIGNELGICLGRRYDIYPQLMYLYPLISLQQSQGIGSVGVRCAEK